MSLLSAVLYDESKTVKWLLDKGAYVNVKNKGGETALLVANRGGGVLAEWDTRREIVKLLLDKGADVNVKNKDGETALLLAASRGNSELVELLLDKGADVNAKNKDGNTALVLTRKCGIIRLLLDKGADANVVNNNGLTVLQAWQALKDSGTYMRDYRNMVEILKEYTGPK